MLGVRRAPNTPLFVRIDRKGKSTSVTPVLAFFLEIMGMSCSLKGAGQAGVTVGVGLGGPNLVRKLHLGNPRTAGGGCHPGGVGGHGGHPVSDRAGLASLGGMISSKPCILGAPVSCLPLGLLHCRVKCQAY